MYLIESWRESLLFLSPKQAKLFAMLSLKNALDAYAKLFQLPLLLATIAGASVVFLRCWYPHHWLLSVCAVVAYFFYSLLTALLVRPSVKQKESKHYFCHYGVHYLVQLFVVFFVSAQLFYLLGIMRWFAFLLPLILFFTFFFIDSRGALSDMIHSMRRALKMVRYNLPICLIISICIRLFIKLISVIIVWLLAMFGITDISLQPMVILLCMPLATCIFMNVYIKRLHDQFTVYFPPSAH